MSAVTGQVTNGDRMVLMCVPHANRAFARNQDVVRILEVGYGYKPKSVYRRLQSMENAGLIETKAGYCRRTPAGDAALVQDGRS